MLRDSHFLFHLFLFLRPGGETSLQQNTFISGPISLLLYTRLQLR